MTNFISREQVLEIVRKHNVPELTRELESLFSFPAPNPTHVGGRNVMGQTEEEFWDAVDAEERAKKRWKMK
jgi:hypothetical protein